MTVAEAIKWAASRACKDCRKSDNPQHPACGQAQDTAELIRVLAERVQ